MTDPITLQIIGNALLYASEEMGVALRDSSYSPNIRERMDHSAAVFDKDCRLVAQAEHIPVHLGSLPWGLTRMVEACQSSGPIITESTMVVSNDPYLTGTHLNDVTLLAPVHHRGELVAFVVNKAHHSDVGGLVPGSISMGARYLGEEGRVIEPSVLWRRGSFAGEVLDSFASSSRTPSERKGDLRAQVAANITGIRRVSALISKHGLETFEAALSHSIARSETLSRRRISRLAQGTFSAVDSLEGLGGKTLRLRARVTLRDGTVAIDYSGTSSQVNYPLNAVFGVTLSGAYFVLRCLLGDDIPANHGAFAPISVSAPVGSLLNPTPPHPVGGGNVETSQRNADVLFRALSKAAPGIVPAAAGGSMNNIMAGGTFRGATWAFYETLGVGLGGSSAADGIDGIQSNMTNTMNTPIEEMERAFPIRVVRYSFRPDSGGAGAHRGGSGLVRAYQATEATTFTILAEREARGPWGLEGGKSGATTEVVLIRGRRTRRVSAKSTLRLRPGDVLEVRTAGGGGHGKPSQRNLSAILSDLESGLYAPSSIRRSYIQAPRDRI